MTHLEQINKLPQGVCKHCHSDIYLTTVEMNNTPQWIHKNSGSAYCGGYGAGETAELLIK